MNAPYTVSPQALYSLPLRAVSAFAARCARRAESRLVSTEGYPPDPAYRAALDAAIRTAEAFARGEAIDSASVGDAANRATEIASAIEAVEGPSRRGRAMREAAMAALSRQTKVL